MGNSSSTSTNTTILATEVVANAYLAVTQDISQGVIQRQAIDVRCGNEVCDACSKTLKAAFKDTNKDREKMLDDFVSRQCKDICTCVVKDISLKQSVTFNAAAFLEQNAATSFATQINNSIAQKADIQTTPFSFAENQTNLANISQKIYKSLSSSTFQAAVQSLQSTQVVTLKGGGTVQTVQMTQAVDYISSVLLSNKETSDLVSELQTIINQSMKVTQAGLVEIIKYIVYIVVALLAIVMLVYTMNLMGQAYTLTVTK